MVLIDITINLFWTYVESFPWYLNLIKKKKFLQFESQTPSPPSVFGIPPFSIGLLSIFYSKPQRNLRIFIICRSRRASKFASPHLSYFVAILRHYSFDNTCCPNTVSTSSLLLTRSFVPLFFPSFQFSLFFAVRISTDNFQVPCIIVGTQWQFQIHQAVHIVRWLPIIFLNDSVCVMCFQAMSVIKDGHCLFETVVKLTLSLKK